MSMTTYDLCHAFFHSDKRNNVSNNIRYEGNNIYSYYTQIGMIYKSPEDDRTYTFVSINNFSNSTIKHINALKDCSPYDIIFVPSNYGMSWTIDTLFELFQKRLIKLYEDTKLFYAPQRREYIELYVSLNQFIKVTGKKLKKAVADELRTMYDFACSNPRGKSKSQTIAELDKKRDAKRKARERAKLKALREKIGEDICGRFDLLGYYAYTHFPYTDETKERTDAVREYIKLTCCKHALIWLGLDGMIHTSKHISMPLDTCKSAYERLVDGTLKVGMHVGTYSISDINDDSIVIGCHNILRKNIDQVFGGKK